VVKEAIAEADRRLADVDGIVKVCLNIVDDVGENWTNRHFAESIFRFGADREESDIPERRMVVVPSWTSEFTPAVTLKQRTLQAIYRLAYQDRHGLPKTLADMMDQEGFALLFSLGDHPEEDPEELREYGLEDWEIARSQRMLSRHLDSTEFPTQFACFFGDAASVVARVLPRTVHDGAALTIALIEARAKGIPPEAALRAD
jgi:hypothetical protein